MCLNHLAINTGYYMLIPILAILLTKEKLLSLSEIALVLLVFSSTIRGSQFFTGPFLDTLSSRTTLVLGALLTGGSYVVMSYVSTAATALLSSDGPGSLCQSAGEQGICCEDK
jgi:predicted MFS family arabinose efflux permease